MTEIDIKLRTPEERANYLERKMLEQLAELARLRAELEQARRERDEARKAHAAIEYAYKMATGVLPFDPHDELNQLRVSNRYMLEELTRLRADRQAGKE